MFFFFQAEDGIRDLIVTGVQTCALPISGGFLGVVPSAPGARGPRGGEDRSSWHRSEERREGKSVDLGGRRIIKKKKIRKGTEREDKNYEQRDNHKGRTTASRPLPRHSGR